MFGQVCPSGRSVGWESGDLGPEPQSWLCHYLQVDLGEVPSVSWTSGLRPGHPEGLGLLKAQTESPGKLLYNQTTSN